MVEGLGPVSSLCQAVAMVATAPEPLPGLSLLPQEHAVKGKKPDVSAVRVWPSRCGRNVPSFGILKQGDRLVGDVLDTLASPNNGGELSLPAGPEPAEIRVLGQDESSVASIVGKINRANGGKELPRRRVSAIRKWPAVCGRNVPRLGRGECLQHLAERKESMSVATKESKEEPNEISELSPKMEESCMSTKMVYAVDKNLEVRIDKGMQMVVKDHSQMNQSQFKEQNQRPNGMVNEARKQMLMMKAANGRATSHSKAISQSSELFGNLDRTLAVKMDKGKQKHVEVAKQIQIRASSEVQLQKLKAGCPRSSSNQSKLPLIRPKLRTWTKLSSSQEASLEDREIVLALKAAPNCPWQPGKCRSNYEGYVSDKKGKRASEIHFPN